MDRNKLKQYAPRARRDFIQAVTDRAAFYGLTEKNVEPITVEGDVALLAGRAFPKKVADQRKRLEERVKRHGFDQVMEAMAYTWFNRLVAIRFMELHGYLEHGYRVLSTTNHTNSTNEKSPDSCYSSNSWFPEILEYAEHVDLPGLDKKKVIDLKLEGTKESELYRMLLIAQCNALHDAMPFLFERIDDETELLLPDNLLHSDSLIRKLVNEIPEEDWQEVEIIGWLYQFYISEKKDEVIGKVVKSEDIPAATQLFTPNWIVKYLVQNSLGRQWMATYPNSPLKDQMEYYIEPAEQTPEVEAQLKEITPESLNPEELTLLDPACGSGHILVEAYDLLKAIYQERGYRAKDIPRLILEKNLYGLEIDDRAAQLAAFALMMKARADDRRIFERDVQPHVLAIQESKGLDAREITEAMNAPLERDNGSVGNVSNADVGCLVSLFEHAKTLGSLIQVPQTLAGTLPAIAQRAESVRVHGGMFERNEVKPFTELVAQATLLSRDYEAVVTNPPFIGSKAMNSSLREFLAQEFPTAKSDIFAAFILRCNCLVSDGKTSAFVSPFVWMFISTYLKFREELYRSSTISSLVQLEYNAFEPACVPVCLCVFSQVALQDFKATYINLSEFKGHQNQAPKTLEAINDPKCSWKHHRSLGEFSHVPNRPVSYWLANSIHQAFRQERRLGDVGTVGQGSTIGDNESFIRWWYEVEMTTPGKWLPCIKGGPFRRWAGNRGRVVKWMDDGSELKNFKRATIRNLHLLGRGGVDWSRVTNSLNSFRLFDGPVFAESGGGFLYVDGDIRYRIAAFLNSRVAQYILRAINPTLNCQTGDVAALPFIDVADLSEAKELMELSVTDWNQSETSVHFSMNPLAEKASRDGTLRESMGAWTGECMERISRMKQLEERNNRRFIDAYGLSEDLVPDVPEEHITLYRPECGEDIKRLISYVVGCMMGRYSLDEPGLIYAHSGNEGFDPSRYNTFPADKDGIVPITDIPWFEDDAANRVEEFIATAWPKEHLEENLKFVAESLGPKRGESSRDTIRRYLATGFYKHHLSMYKKRPIYWLFSSGKGRAFQCLVYLHRYNEGTLSRMRTEYVIPLSGKMASRIEQLDGDIAAATSSSREKKLQKRRDTLVKQREELQKFDEKLRHYADQRIKLDLDDGVKVNYGKFGYLLAEVKAVTGKKPGE